LQEAKEQAHAAEIAAAVAEAVGNARSPTLSVPLTHPLTHSISLSLSHTHTDSLTLSHKHTLTHSHAHNPVGDERAAATEQLGWWLSQAQDQEQVSARGVQRFYLFFLFALGYMETEDSICLIGTV